MTEIIIVFLVLKVVKEANFLKDIICHFINPSVQD